MARNPNRPSRRGRRSGGEPDADATARATGLPTDDVSASGLPAAPNGGAADDALDGTPAPDPLKHASPDIEKARMRELGPVDGDEPGAPDAEQDLQGGSGADEAETLPAASGGRKGGALTFVRNCVEELRRVQWPNRRQVGSATTVVLGFVVLAGGYLGALDAALKPLVEAIL